MKPIRKISSVKYHGLGDVVAVVAQPIAKAIDAVAGTKIRTCGGCAKRRAALNETFPFSTNTK